MTSYEKMKIYVGILITTMTVFILYFGYIFMDKKGYFDTKYTYYCESSNANSLQVGMPVKYSGIKIGTITQLNLKDDGNVKIKILINEEYQKFLNKGSSLTLNKSLIGSSLIELNRTTNEKIIPEGSIIQLNMNKDIKDIAAKLEPVTDKLIKLIENLETISGNFAKEDSPLNKTLINLEKITKKFEQSDSLLTTITGKKESADILIDSLQSINRTLQNLEQLSQGLEQNLIDPSSKIVENINTILLDVQIKLKKLDQTINTVVDINPSLKYIKKDIADAVNKSNEVLDKVKSVISNNQEPMELP